ncbi:uncharacterized protein LOC144619290 [Crassostrea virginica]
MEDQQTYLGVTFDKRLTWKQHIMSAEAKARRKLNIMRKLAGTNWGANEKVLKSVYEGNVRPHLEYGSSAWFTAAKSHHQALDKVQNQALRIITGAMKSTSIARMEEITNIPTLSKRRECKAMIQATKYKSLPDHPMKEILKQLSSGRLKKSSFTLETRALQRKHQEHLPNQVQPIVFETNDHLCTEKEDSVDIQTAVPLLSAKNEQSEIVRKAVTMTMLDEKYPSENWKVLQALSNNKLPQLERTIYSLKSLKTVVQWIPSHCGIIGNEKADKLANEGAKQDQEENAVSFTEMKTIIKSLHNTPQQQDSYHQLSRPEQTIIFRLRTGHNRLNQHLYRVMKVIPSLMCPCGEAEQNTEHFLQTCKLHLAQRQKIWDQPTSIKEKLFGSLEDLQKTARFVVETGTQVSRRTTRRRRSVNVAFHR